MIWIKIMLRIISHTPTINETNVYRNPTIKFKFDKGLNPNSISYINLSVNDYNTYVSVPGAIGVEYTSGVADTLVFNPSVNLSPSAKYKVYVYGNENSVISVDNEQLTDTYSYSFTTGDSLYDITTSGGIPSGVVPPSNVYVPLLGGVPSGISDFYVYSTSPKNQTPNLDLELKRIVVAFTGTLNSTCKTYRYISIEEEDVI
jgi:hypothetical protein